MTMKHLDRFIFMMDECQLNRNPIIQHGIFLFIEKLKLIVLIKIATKTQCKVYFYLFLETGKQIYFIYIYIYTYINTFPFIFHQIIM